MVAAEEPVAEGGSRLWLWILVLAALALILFLVFRDKGDKPAHEVIRVAERRSRGEIPRDHAS